MKPITIIPKPSRMELQSGTFSLTSETHILISESTRAIGEFLAQRLRPATGFPLKVKQLEQASQFANCIMLQTAPDKQALGEEAVTGHGPDSPQPHQPATGGQVAERWRTSPRILTPWRPVLECSTV